MARDHVLDDGEAKASSLPQAASGIDPIEPLSQPRQVLAIDAGARIADPQHGVPVRNQGWGEVWRGGDRHVAGVRPTPTCPPGGVLA